MPLCGQLGILLVKIIREFFFSFMDGKMLSAFPYLPVFSIVSPNSQLWGLDNPDDNAKVVLGTSTHSQTQYWVLDLIEF